MLKKMQAIILETLSRPDFYAVVDSDTTILIAPRDVDENGWFNRENVESIILDAVSRARRKLKEIETKGVTSELKWLSPQNTEQS
jgi:hypothetical protein